MYTGLMCDNETHAFIQTFPQVLSTYLKFLKCDLWFHVKLWKSLYNRKRFKAKISLHPLY